MKTMKSKKNKKNKSQKAQQSFTERIAKAAGGFKERAKSMNSEEKAEQVQQPEQPETQQAQPEGGETEVDVKALQAELEKAKAQSDEYLDLAQRKQAEFANYRRRTEGIRAEAFDDGRREAIGQLLPIVDNLERALAAAGEEENKLRRCTRAKAREDCSTARKIRLPFSRFVSSSDKKIAPRNSVSSNVATSMHSAANTAV